MKKCDECKGQGEIELFTSWAECEKCGGTGEVGGSNDLSEDNLDRVAKVVSSRPSSPPIQMITGRSAGIEHPFLEEVYKRKYAINSERTSLFRDDWAQAEQRIARQMTQALGLTGEEDGEEN